MLLSIGMLMLSATQIYTILTVQLFAFLNLLPVEADILAYNLENGTQTFDDLPARFGYRLPAEGLKGFLINSKPENACEPIAPPPLRDNSSSAFIVLIRRLECNFDIKVLNAQRAGYKAAIVHNVDSDDLISMGSNDIEVLKKIDIPSVFIGETSANSLKEEFTYEKGGHVVLIPEFSLPLEYYLIPFLIIVGICLILIVIFMITKFVQDRHRARRNRLRKDQLKKIPVHKFKKGEVLKNLNKFYKRKEIQRLGAENGLDARLFHQAFISFRKYIMESSSVSADLHIILNDICCDAGHVDDLFPFFLRHAKQIFPMLDCMDDLRKISDLRLPPNWYPDARAIQRKIIFHAGPTNSGKTYHAIQRFLSAKSGIYCGPLKLLAHEIFQKSNNANVPCDLVTGEERVYANEDARQAPHIACTIEMCSTNTPYEVAVIDEIQMIRDPARGWAWTRALLGLCAEEIHVCGEAAAIDLVTELMYTTGEEVEVRNYERLTPLTVLDYALESLDNLRPGDCIVCFSKNDIYSISRQIEARGLECAVIYGSLPPGTKLEQAKKFNDPDDPCKILVATDAIGMGLNLCIRRIIFNSIVKPTINEKGEKEIDSITTSQALQIAGRAGRYGSSFKQGEVTTMHRDDLIQLKEILSETVRPVKAAGLHPTPEQIEMFAYHLPDATLSNLIDIFVSLSQVDGLYFVCNIDDFKFLADMIQHIPLNLRSRYVFCTAPLNRKEPFVCTTLLKFARQFSRNEPLTFDWLCQHTKWPLAAPKNIKELVHLEAVHDVFDLYLWLSYRFMDMFPDAVLVRDIQKKLDDIIQVGVSNITKLIRASQSAAAPGTAEVVSEDFPLSRTKRDTRVISDRHSARSTEALSIAVDVPGERRAKNLKAYRSSARQEDLKSYGRGSLANRLLREGLLTQEMLRQLESEWQDQHRNGRYGIGSKRDDQNSSKEMEKQKK